jgi:fibronectin-binding autotransporter adhesin
MKTSKLTYRTLPRLTLPALVLALLAGAGLSSPAATITFKSPVTCAADTDPLPVGQAAYAYDWGTSATLNGVPFTSTTSFGNVGAGNVTLVNFAQALAATFVGTNAPYTNLSAAYQNVLKGAVLTNNTSLGTTGTVSLNVLNPGHLYAVQVWVNDSRGGAFGTRLEWIYDGSGGATNVLTFDVGQTNGGLGQFVLGTFLADNSSQNFVLDNSAPGNSQNNNIVQMNALQLRDVSSVWSGTTSGTWADSDTTSSNFSGFNYSTVKGLGLTNVYFGDVDGFGNPVATSTVSVGAGGASGLNAVFQNKLVAYTVNSADATGIAGNNNVTLNGTNTVTFTGAHTYTGNTVLGSGAQLLIGPSASIAGSSSLSLGANSTLTLGNSGALAGSSSLSLAAGSVLDASSTSLPLGAAQTLSGYGTVKGNVAAASGATIVPGTLGGVGTLTFNNNLTLNAQTFSFDLGFTAGSPSDKIVIGGALTLNGTSLISLNVPTGPLFNGIYTLLTFASKSGGTFALDKTYPGITLNINPTSVTLTVTGGITAGGTSGVWTNLTAGNWTTAANWQNNVIATNVDAVADFSTLRMTAANSVNVASTNITIGYMVFGDVGQAFNWTLTGGTNSLAVSSGSPTVMVYPAQNTTISAALHGTQGFTKAGAGTLTLSGANVMSGGINVVGGTLVGSSSTAFGSASAPTANPITLSNASLTISAALANNAWTNNLFFAGASNTITAGALTPGFKGASGSSLLNGAGTVTLNCGGNNPALAGHMDGFSGTLIINGTSGGLLMAHNQDPGFYPGADGITGSPTAVFDFEGGAVNYMYNGAMPGTNYLGELRGNSGAVLWAKNGRSGAVTLEIGGLGTSSTFAGTFKDNRQGATANTPINLRKVGAGTLTLSGTSTATGYTDVRGGTLLVSGGLGVTPVTVESGATFNLAGSVSSPTITVNAGGNFLLGGGNPGSAAITVNGLMDVTAFGSSFNLNSASLSGSGVVTGAVTVSSTSLNPGPIGGPGTLTITNGDFTAIGGSLIFDLSNDPTNGVNDLLVVNGNLNLNNPGVALSINRLTGGLGAGHYPLIKFSAAFNGSLTNLTLSGAGPLDTLQQNGNEIDLVVTAVPTITWTGGTTGNLWDIATSLNWLLNGLPAPFTNGEIALFSDLGGTNPVVTIPATVQPAAVVVSATSNYTFTGSADIADGASLTKSGSGTLTILNTNTFVGGTFLNGGTLALGDGVTYNGSVVGNIADSAALVFANPLDQAYGGIISGAGKLTKLGAGTLTLAATNTLSGPTTISTGTLALGDGVSANGLLGSGPITNNSTLAINCIAVATVSNRISGVGSIVNLGAGPVTLAGAISGFSSLTNDPAGGTGTLNLAASNSFSGGTFINGGNVMLQNFSGFGSGNVSIADGGNGQIHLAPVLGATNVLANNIMLPAASQQQFMMDGTSLGVRTTVRLTGVLSGGSPGSPTILVDSGVNGNTRGVLLLDNPANSFTTIPEVFRGTLALTSDSALGNGTNGIQVNSANNWTPPFDATQMGLRFDANNIVLNANRTIELVGIENIDVQAFTATIAGPIFGTGLIKEGAGTLILNGPGSLTNGTTVTAGTLVLNNTWTGTSLAVNSGATLSGTGVIDANVQIASGGTLAVGAPSTGTLTVANNLTFASGSNARMKINAATAASDQIAGIGTVTFAGALTVSNLGGTPGVGQVYHLFNATTYSGNFTSFSLPSPGSGAWSWDPTKGTLSVVGVVSTTPTNITFAVSGGNLHLSWPPDHTGWRLLTNSVSIANTNFWFPLPGSASTNQVFLPLDPTKANVFFRLVYP